MKIFIADDQDEFRDGLRDLLASAQDVVVIGEASNGMEAVSRVLESRPDVTLMDIRMPVMDGITATRSIRERWPSACILMLTTFDEDRLIRASVSAGALGYLLKGTPLDDMLAVFALAIRGYTAIGKGVRLAVPEERNERIAQLSVREQEILALIGQGCTNRDIGQRLFLTEGTVKNYVSQILTALGARHRTEAALLWRARGSGDDVTRAH